MNRLAKALMYNKSFKQRQECLSLSLDSLSFNYPEVFIILFREMKRRELEANDPNKITQWLSSPKSNSYVKLHEALMLVKSSNVIAKEEYLKNLKCMLYHTLENGTCIDMTVKICRLIEKTSSLYNIFVNLKYLIDRVKHFKKHTFYTSTTIVNENLKHDNFISARMIKSFTQMNIQFVPCEHQQQQSTSIWPITSQSICSEPNYCPPYFSLECSGYDRFEMIETAQKPCVYPQTHNKLTIISQDMDRAVTEWLYYLKLHKYQWFFKGLSYLEIQCIDEVNIEGFVAQVNRNSITKGAQKKICISTKTLRERPQKLSNIIMALDLEVTPNELCEFMSYMRDILHYPIPNKNCVADDKLQQYIVLVMEKSLNLLLENLHSAGQLFAQSLLGTSINKYLECTMLIANNQTFMEEQIDQTLAFASKLKNRVQQMPRNFY